MKATDLMVEDWVEVIQNSEKRFAQVQMIDGYEDNATSNECLCDSIYYSIDELNPIPLTLEIMKANGFNIKVSPYTPNWIRCILNPNFFLEDRLKGFYHFNGNNLAKIQYVHELQHALKLCGIHKEIEL